MKSDTVSTVSPSISHEVMGPDAMILVYYDSIPKRSPDQTYQSWNLRTKIYRLVSQNVVLKLVAAALLRAS